MIKCEKCGKELTEVSANFFSPIECAPTVDAVPREEYEEDDNGE